MKKKILYVEDCPELQEMTLAEMTSWLPEAEIVTADSGNKAQMILTERADFDLIVTDYQMVDGNGLELLEFCQRGQLGIPVIVFHGGSVGPEVFLASRNCAAVILKPNHEELRGRMFSQF
jgi:CheY-like chemotaxis protein